MSLGLLTKHEPDELDIRCDKVFEAIEDIPCSEKIGVLEQVIDYIRLGIANNTRLHNLANDDEDSRRRRRL